MTNIFCNFQQNNKRMSCRDFIENFSHTDYSYNPAILKELYAAIKEQPFHYGSAQVNQTSSPTTRTNNKEKRMSRVLSMKGSASSSALINPEQQVDYKHGWLLKKSIYDADGKKSEFSFQQLGKINGKFCIIKNIFSSHWQAQMANAICDSSRHGIISTSKRKKVAYWFFLYDKRQAMI
jgi:hypothetical protein